LKKLFGTEDAGGSASSRLRSANAPSEAATGLGFGDLLELRKYI